MSTYSDLIGGSAGSATTVYAALADLPLSNVVAGAQAYVSATNRLYLWSGAGWYNIALINTAPTITTGGDASYALASDGTATVITLEANDPEGIPITWSYAVTAGSLASAATVSQADNVFTITPSTTEADAGEFSLTFTASDGVNIATSASAFTLAFAGDWTLAAQQAKIQSSDIEALDNFGKSVSISGDGNTAIVGAQKEDTGNTDVGAAYIFTRSGSTWTEQAKIQASDKEAYDYFGDSVSISSDGNTAVVGANGEDTGGTNAGAAYIFTRSGSTWTQQAKIQSSDIEASDTFGPSVSLSDDGNTVIVGAWQEDTGASNAGAAYIFTRSGSTWTQQAKIQASDPQVADYFGYSVSISGDGNTAVVGAHYEDTGTTNAGSAYIFTRSGTTWSQEAMIQASDIGGGDQFGKSVSISSDSNTAIVGAQNEDTGASNAGAAYIFTRSGSTWTQQAKIQASDKEASDYFGENVSISGDGNTVIAGARFEDTGASDAGAAYIFTRSGSTWTQQAKIQSSDIEATDYFGYSVSISGDGNTVIAGSHYEDTGGSLAGSAYIFVAG
jgi:hypothetical protein